jgi:hypothetical protein
LSAIRWLQSNPLLLLYLVDEFDAGCHYGAPDR